MKLRFADEDPAALDMVKSLVEPLVYEVLALADSRQAAECVNKQKFDGVFVDLQMPNLDGFQLTSLIRASQLNSRVPIVMISAFGDVETMRHGYRQVLPSSLPSLSALKSCAAFSSPCAAPF